MINPQTYFYPPSILFILSLSCSNGRQAQQVTPPPVQDLQPSEIRKQEGFDDIHGGSPAGNIPIKTDGFQERYDFGTHLPSAHLRSGGLLVDFGTPSRDKYTLADWMGGIKGNYEKEGLTYSYVTGNTGHIYFHALEDEAGGGIAAFHVKAAGSKKARIYLNDAYVGSIGAGAEFSHAQVSFDTGIASGLNEIKIQCNGKARTTDGVSASLALDYVRIIPNGTDNGPAAAAYDTLAAAGSTPGASAIALAGGESATFYLPIPQNSRLRGRVRPQDNHLKSQFTLTVRTDIQGESAVTEMAVAAPLPFDLDLSPAGGEVGAVTFTASGGGIVIENAQLVEKNTPRPKAPGSTRAKNLILVLIDTLRADKLDLYNPNTVVKTDYLSALSKEAMIFERAFAPENWTKPSVASLLTGLYPDTHGTKSDRDVLPSDVVMIPEHLKALGFVTAGFVANGYVSDKFGFKQGWDTWTNYVREGKPNRAQFVVGDAVAWLNKRTDDRPFFMYVHTIDPHVPYIPPNKYLKMYDDGLYNGPVEASATAKIAEGIKTGRVKLNERDKVRYEALYNGEITYHDDQLVLLQNTLTELGLLENTAVIITADHGEEFFDHGSAGHGHSLYEELVHVPLIVRLQGTHNNNVPARDGDEVSLVDIFPTICEVLGVECPKEAEGKSLVPRLKAEARDIFPSASFAEFLDNQKAIRMGRFKLILRGLRTTLFDLTNDPGETRDLSDEYPIALTALRDALSGHLARSTATSIANGDKKALPKKHKVTQTVIDKETADQLKALGYLGGE